MADPNLVKALWKPEVFFPNAKETLATNQPIGDHNSKIVNQLDWAIVPLVNKNKEKWFKRTWRRKVHLIILNQIR